MKKLLLGTAFLFLFSVAMVLVQLSCSKTNAQSSNTSLTQLNKLVYYRQFQSNPVEIWISNYDGSGQSQIPVVLPVGVTIAGDILSAVRLSPDGQKLFFTAINNTSGSTLNSIYSCNIDGSNVQQVIAQSSDVVRIGGAY